MGAEKEQMEVPGGGIPQGKEVSDDSIQVSAEWSVGSVDGSPSPLRELLKRRKNEQVAKSDHDPVVVDAGVRPITVYHRTLFKFKLSCRSSDATSSKSLRQLFKKEREQDYDLWWKRAVRKTMLVFKFFSPRTVARRMQRCYNSSADYCAAGLDYKGFPASTGRQTTRRRSADGTYMDEEGAEKLAIQNFFAAPLDSVRAARPFDCSREQCGWSQEFSWESTHVDSHYSGSYQRQQLQQQLPTQSITSTTMPESRFYSSNLMTPYEINHSFRRTIENSRSRSEADN